MQVDKTVKAMIFSRLLSLIAVSAFISLWAAPITAAQVAIPDGPFPMGCSLGDPECENDEGMAGGTRVVVPGFEIDTHEVTVSQYRVCVEDGPCTVPKDHNRNQYCNYDGPGRGDHPVNCIDWRQAVAYCRNLGKRLPREAEWEKAARAGSATRYPWGQEVSCKQAIVDDGETLGTAGDEPDGCGEDRTWPVGSRRANAFGLFDMHGNVGEWTANWYAPDAITSLYAKGDLDGPGSGKRRVVRGGSWDENRANLRSSFRNVKAPEQGKRIYGSIGFRCVADIR
ncbi:MAG: formylglycine-generating enzyme family protein [Gammaproteobacteria bacterium]|nr:formylglycine-generating enzyme family protein [Gammaproteobacteria bacterium]